MSTKAVTTEWRSAARAAGIAIGSALLLTTGGAIPALADPTPDEILFQSAELKIYRTLSKGTPVVVLTNVDAEGNFLMARESSGGRPEIAALQPPPGVGPAGAPPERPPAAPGPAEEPGRVRVVVHGEGGAPSDERDVEVTTERTGDTTVIVNINPPAPLPQPPPPAVEAPVWSYPVVVSGLPGPFRYPEHQYFLGYGPGTSSPSMFGGLGLNAGNGFGLKTGVPCDKGYDCMFGPKTGAP